MKFLVIKTGVSESGRSWAVGAVLDAPKIVGVGATQRVMCGVKKADGTNTPVQPGIIDAQALVLNPAHTGENAKGETQEYADSYTLIV